MLRYVSFGTGTYEVLLSGDPTPQRRISKAAPHRVTSIKPDDPSYRRELVAGSLNWRRAIQLAIRQPTKEQTK